MAKDFKNPTMQFITHAEEQFTPGAGEDMEQYPEELREDLPRPEPKSRRVQLLIKPSLYKRIKDEAAAEGVSVNELIARAIRDYLRAAEKRKNKKEEVLRG